MLKSDTVTLVLHFVVLIFVVCGGDETDTVKP